MRWYRNIVVNVAGALLLGGVSWLVGTQADAASAIQRTPSQTKAVYIANVAKYTTWPEHDGGQVDGTPSNGDEEVQPLVIGVVGPDPNSVIEVIRDAVQSREGMKIGPQPVALIDFPSLTANEERRSVVAALGESHVLFFSDASESDWEKLKPMLQGRPIMTMSELPGFAVAGGMVEFEYDQSAQRVYMIINLEAVREAGIVISANLLRLKKIIKPLNSRPPR